MRDDINTTHHWEVPKKTLAEQAAERGEPMPAVGSTAAELRARGYEIEHALDGMVVCADPESPSGFAWRTPRAVIETITGGRPVTAKHLREKGLLRPGSPQPNWSGVKEFVYDEDNNLKWVEFWPPPLNDEVMEENARREQHGLWKVDASGWPAPRDEATVSVRMVEAPEFALAVTGAAEATQALLDDVSKKAGIP